MPAPVQQIQDAYSAEPFQPFALHLQDGRQVPVARRHCLQFTETAAKIIVTQPGGRVDTISAIDVLGIVAVHAESIAAYAQAHPVDDLEKSNWWARRPMVFTRVTGPGRGIRWHHAPWKSPLKASLGIFALAVFILLVLTCWT